MYKTGTERGRFAPSPSGQLHMGNLASCLLAWLDARSAGAGLVFRMEDLDPERSSRRSEDSIFTSLRALGLDWDEGYPCDGYSQSGRSDKYDEVFELLLGAACSIPAIAAAASGLQPQRRIPVSQDVIPDADAGISAQCSGRSLSAPAEKLRGR